MIYVFTGEGKGKTSAALGVTLRALLSGWRVLWVSFIKEEKWQISEQGLRDKFDGLEMYFVGKGFYIRNSKLEVESEKLKFKAQKLKTGGVVIDKVEEEEHRRAAREGLKLVEEKLSLGGYQLVVMDEINKAIQDGLLSEKEVVEVLKKRGKANLVLTGRGTGKKIREMADLVTECRKIKHPYDKGIMAVKGLDY